MMRSLAERAPMLFRKNVVSVDILTQSEEEVLEYFAISWANIKSLTVGFVSLYLTLLQLN